MILSALIVDETSFLQSRIYSVFLQEQENKATETDFLKKTKQYKQSQSQRSAVPKFLTVLKSVTFEHC